jgi:hypothetical protein
VSAPQFPPGHVVAGKYTIRALIAYAGSSATYSAVTGQGRDVILRAMSPQLAQRNDVLSTLARAAAVTNALPAGTTAPVLDSAFDAQTGAPYVVTEVVPMPTLAQMLARGALPPNDIAALLRGIARAVDAAHAQRLAHGALKPGNVFVAPSAEPPVRVVDFGASVVRAALPTAEGRAGAAPWMAPEQLQGTTDGPTVDVFSAALVAFFAVTGRSYWRSCQGAAPDLAAWQQEIAGPRVAPSMRARELGVSLQPSWDAVLGRALSAQPGARFGSIGEFAEALANAAPAGTDAPQQPYAAPPVAPAQAQYAAAPGQPPAQAQYAAPGQPPAQAQYAAPGQPPAQAQYTAQGQSPAQGQPPPQAPYAAQAQYPEPPAEIPRSKNGLAIILALVGVVVVGIVIALVVVLKKPKPDPAAVASMPSASASVPAGASPPPASAAAPSASVAGPTSPETPDAAPAADLAQLTIVCAPECDSVSVDDDTLDAGWADPMSLAAGPHTVVVGKASYVSQTRKITLKAGQKEKASFFLAKPGAAPSKPCGKFLERCPQ